MVSGAVAEAEESDWRALYDGIVPESAASMLKPRPEDGCANLGGSIRVNGLAVLRLLRIPALLRVGDRPAGALRGEDLIAVLSFLIGDLASRIGRRGEAGSGVVVGVRVRKKFTGFWKVAVSLEEPSDALDRFGERNWIGSMFSESNSVLDEKSKVSTLRFEGELRINVTAIGRDKHYVL